MKTELDYLLGKIGKQTFVHYYHLFGDFSITNREVITVLQNDKSFKDHACASKVTNARRIFREHLERNALAIIAESKRKDMTEAVEEARALLELRSV